MEKVYTNYYMSQIGGGTHDIGDVYAIPRVIQSGRGSVGAFFSGIFKYLKPLWQSGISALKNQAIKSGKAVLEDIGSRPITEILKHQSVAAVNELKEKGIRKLKNMAQSGSGLRIKKKTLKAKTQSLTSSKGRHISKLKKFLKNRNKSDIFTN